MKATTRFVLSMLCCAMSGNVMAQHGFQQELTFEVSNPWDRPQADAPVVIPLHGLQLSFEVQGAVVRCDGKEIASQLDDLDRDGKADELALVIDLEAKATRTLQVTLSDRKGENSYPARTFAQMLLRDVKKGKHAPVQSLTVPGTSDVYNLLYGHGPMMESELAGYRIYFNPKQTIDPYGKFQPRLELEACDFYPSDGQLAQGFGDDVLMVGNSCGVGALKGWDGTQATHITPVAQRTQRVVASGPVRAILEVEVKGWACQGTTLDMTQRYLLYAGHRDLQIEVRFARPLDETPLATGVQRIMGTETVMDSDHQGLVGSWGRHWPVTDTVKYAKETIGLATCVPQRYVSKEVSDKDNFLYLVSAPGETSFTYHTMFTSRKETFGYPDAKAWFAYMREWKERLQHPVSIRQVRP